MTSDNNANDDFHVKEKKFKNVRIDKIKFKPIINPKLTDVLDRTEISDRQATFIIGTTIKSLDVDIDSLECN